MPTDKLVAYRSLVEKQKACQACAGLINPSTCAGGIHDSGHLGPWSLWQGNLNAEVIVIGQDWGDENYFIKNHGHDLSHTRTNETLRRLLTSIGLNVKEPWSEDIGDGPLFFTNAVLCLKRGGLQSATDPAWFTNCGSAFLRRTIDLIQPKVVITLGERAYRAVAALYGVAPEPFRAAVDCKIGFELGCGIRLFPVYHSGARITNTHRPMVLQIHDWLKIKAFYCKPRWRRAHAEAMVVSTPVIKPSPNNQIRSDIFRLRSSRYNAPLAFRNTHSLCGSILPLDTIPRYWTSPRSFFERENI
jgi:uracil-DNA glycosylase